MTNPDEEKAPTHPAALMRRAAGFLTDAAHMAAHARDAYQKRQAERAELGQGIDDPDARRLHRRNAGRDGHRRDAADRIRELALRMAETARELAGTDRQDAD